MPRFCAVLSAADAVHELESMGGTPVWRSSQCALGALPAERLGRDVGPYIAGDRLVAAGEVTLFNRAALAEGLARNGTPPPAGCSDGELLLRHYARAGLAGLREVNGMFALAVWDGERLALVRDPVGSRTMFYTRIGATWAAASSLRALRRWLRLAVRLNVAAVQSFLTFAYLPGDETLLQGVHELLPGHALVIDAENESMPAERISYWEPEEVEAEPAAEAREYARHLRVLLESATLARLPGDKPVGVFLSGGIDSSLVTALAARLHSGPVFTYAIHFGQETANELAYSGLVAAHCQTRHRVLGFSGRQVAAHLAEAVALLDCPVGDPLTVPNLLLARAAAADGNRVVLNGEGGDPVFGGPKNLPMLLFELHQPNADATVRARAYLRAYRKLYDELPRLLTPEVHQALRHARPLEWLVQPYLETDRMDSYLNRLLFTNLRTKGAHHILTKVERLTAASGVEGRSPLFDIQVVAYSFAIPPALKLAGTKEKWILKQAVRDLLPRPIVERPKSGMRVPVQQWLRGPLRELANDLLLSRQARARGLFRPEIIREWLCGEGLLWPRHGAALWLVLTLELWLRAFLDRDEVDPAYFGFARGGVRRQPTD